MLQIEKFRIGKHAEAFGSEPQSPHTELWTALVGLLRRQSSIFMIVPPLALVMGMVYIFVAPTKYTAQADFITDTYKIQSFKLQSLEQQPAAATAAAVDPLAVDTQVQILKSSGIAQAVLNDQHLIGDPEFTGERGSLFPPLIKMISRFFLTPRSPSTLDLNKTALDIFKKNLTIAREPGTYFLEIYYTSVDANRAATIANAVADAYVNSFLDAKYEAAQHAAIWLQKRSDELREQAVNAERAAVEYRTKNNIVDTGGAEKKLVNQQQLSEFTTALIQAQAQTAEARARLDRANNIIVAQSPTDRNIDPATVSDSLHNDVITKLRNEYLALAEKKSEWAKRYGHGHLAVINLEEQMKDISDSIENELRRIVETYKSEYEISKSREDSARKSLSEIVLQSNATSEAQVTLHTLDSNAQTYRNIYENLMQRYTESIHEQTFPLSEARLITRATVPTKHSQPNVPLVVAISAVGGLMLAFWVSIFRDMSDHVFRDGSQIEAALKAECIGILPALKHIAKPFDAPVHLLQGSRRIARGRSLPWHVIDTPFSRFSEAIRSIKMAADLFELSRSNKIVGITSSLPNEGKSTLATALALSLASGHAQVLLVDCDLRNASLSRDLAPKAKAGLLEVLSGRAPVDAVVWKDALPNLSFLPVVMKSRIAHTGEILGAVRTKQIFESLRENYDYVVVDLSPLGPVADVRATTAFIDSYIYVIEWGQTNIQIVKHSLKSAGGVYEKLLGVALNKANESWLQRFEIYRGQYRNGEYGYVE